MVQLSTFFFFFRAGSSAFLFASLASVPLADFFLCDPQHLERHVPCCWSHLHHTRGRRHHGLHRNHPDLCHGQHLHGLQEPQPHRDQQPGPGVISRNSGTTATITATASLPTGRILNIATAAAAATSPTVAAGTASPVVQLYVSVSNIIRF